LTVWGLLFEPFGLGYMRRALIEVVLLGVLGGVVGVHVLLRRLAFLTEVVQHTVFPGIAIAFALDQSLLAGAVVAGTVAVVLYTVGARKVDSNALMALLIATFFALGVVVVSRRAGFQSDLTALLFGRILSVDQQELIDTLIIGVVAVALLLLLHKELVLRAFDPLGSEAMGYPTVGLDLVVNVVVMLTVVAAVRAVGTVLVVAFIVTPAAAARQLCRRIGPMMVLAAGLGAVGGWLGLVVSYEGSIHHGWRLASGATIVLVLTAGFVVVAAGRALVARARRPRVALAPA
jgi:manganese/iron transport system permease protein